MHHSIYNSDLQKMPLMWIYSEHTYIKVTQTHPVGIVKLAVIFLDKALSNLLPYFFLASHLWSFGSEKEKRRDITWQSELC